MDFKIYQSLSGLAELEPLWLSLAEGLPYAQFYQLPQWYKAYAEALASEAENTFFIAGYIENQLHFVLPMVQRFTKVHGIKFTVLHSPSHNHMSLVDGLCSERSLSGNTLQLLFQFLTEQQLLQWDWIYFKKSVENAAVDSLFKTHLFKNTYKKNTVQSYFIDCSCEVEDVFQHMSTKFKRNLRRQERKAKNQGELRFEVLDGEDLNLYFSKFLALEASGWKGESKSAIKYNDDLVLFYRLLIQYQSSMSRCVLNTLFLNDKLIAAQLGIVTSSTMNLIKIAYNEKMSSIAPGNILLNHVIEYCAEATDINEISFVTGPQWANSWKTGERNVNGYLLFNKTCSGKVCYVYTWIKNMITRVVELGKGSE